MPEPISELLPLDRLTPWLAAHVAGFEGPVRAEKFSGGQSNPTFRLDTPSGSYVLRRKPPGVLLKSAHAVEREYRVQTALAGTGVPVARMHALCEDAHVIGAAFYVMEHVPGRVFMDPALPGLAPAQRGAVMDDLNRVLAAIHSVDLGATGLADFGPGGDYYARQIGRWSRQYEASKTRELPEMDALIAWLRAHTPPDDGRRALVHGDYRIDNLLFAPDGPHCVAVLDWELSTVGHPLADLAALMMQWRMPPGTEGRGLAGVDRIALGLPSDAAFVAAYCDRMGLDGIPDFNFYLAFAFFRMGAILEGVKRRARDGNAADPETGLRLGEQVPHFARMGLEAAQG